MNSQPPGELADKVRKQKKEKSKLSDHLFLHNFPSYPATKRNKREDS